MPPRRLQTMNLYGAFSLFALVILLYWIISELFTILFRFTGLPDERARFQVMSLLTGCGFTTKESEGFLSTRSRRRLVQVTMLFGYVFNITIVSAFINVFLSRKQNQVQNFLVGILFPAVIVALVILALVGFIVGRGVKKRKVSGSSGCGCGCGGCAMEEHCHKKA